MPKTVGLGEGARPFVHGGGNKQDETRGNIFDEMGNTGGIIQGDNSGGKCFVVMDLTPMKFFQISCNYETENMHQRQKF